MQAHSHGLPGVVRGAIAVAGGGSGWTRYVGADANGNTDSTGGGNAQNLPPYFSLNHIIKV